MIKFIMEEPEAAALVVVLILAVAILMLLIFIDIGWNSQVLRLCEAVAQNVEQLTQCVEELK